MAALLPQMQAILQAVKEAALPRYETLSAVDARAQAELGNRVWNESPPAVGNIRNFEIPGPGGAMRVRLYEPDGAGADAPALLYIHGGGWVICSLDTHDGVCRRLANVGKFKVLSLDYRMAPEHPFPAPVDDCVAAARWLAENAASLGIDPTRLAIGGDSAGANLSLATCIALRDAGEAIFRTAALVYGAYEVDVSTPSRAAFGGGDYILSSATMDWFWNQYVPDPALHTHPLVAPYYADLRDLPPLYLSAAGFDPLLDDTTRILPKLEEAGNRFTYHYWPGVTHACVMMSRLLDDADRQIAEIAAFLRLELGMDDA